MVNLFLKSTSADFQKITQQLEANLKLINKNILYCTNQLDFIRKEILSMKVDKHLQEQADEYLDREAESSQ